VIVAGCFRDGQRGLARVKSELVSERGHRSQPLPGGPLATGAQTIVPGGGAQLKLQSPDCHLQRGRTATAGAIGSDEISRIDINGPADMNGPAYKTQYTLLYAASSGPMNGSTMVKLLLDNGADPRRERFTTQGISEPSVDIVALLLAKGADPYRMHGTHKLSCKKSKTSQEFYQKVINKSRRVKL